jgi:pimeloyl-ACP methyl ester carboxylesterase
LATSIGLEAPIAVEEGLASSPAGTPIHYVTAGEGEPAVVLIHCWGCDATYWSWQLAALAAERQVVAVDLAGHGASGAEREEWTMEAFGADVAAVVEALGIERAVLVGHSMGGYVMLAAAEQMLGKVAGMVAVDTLHDVEQEYPEEAIANYVAALRSDFPNTVMAAMRQYFPPDADPAVVAAVVTDMAATEPAVGVSAFEHIVSYDAAGALDRLGLPLRAVQATMRPTAEETNRRHAPDYAATYVDGVGHWPMFEAPEAFEAALVERVEELAAGANAGP